MDSKGEDETMKISQGIGALQNVYDDASDDSGGYSSDDCEWITMPNGQPPSVLTVEPGEDSKPSKPDQTLLPPVLATLTAKDTEFQQARPPPAYDQNVANSLHQYEEHSVSNGHKAVPSSHPLPSRPLPASSSSAAQASVPIKQPSAVISAEPVLRDLKKESTAFIPIAIRKKQAAEKAKAIKSQIKDPLSAAQVGQQAEFNKKQNEQND